MKNQFIFKLKIFKKYMNKKKNLIHNKLELNRENLQNRMKKIIKYHL